MWLEEGSVCGIAELGLTYPFELWERIELMTRNIFTCRFLVAKVPHVGSLYTMRCGVESRHARVDTSKNSAKHTRADTRPTCYQRTVLVNGKSF